MLKLSLYEHILQLCPNLSIIKDEDRKGKFKKEYMCELKKGYERLKNCLDLIQSVIILNYSTPCV